MTSRRRFAALTAIVAVLVGGSIGLGALVAIAQPNAIAFTTTSGNVVGPGWTGVSGTVDWTDAGSGGSVSLTVTNSAGTNPFACGSYTAAQEVWSCIPVLQYGTNTITATATETDDPGNPLSTAAPIVITYGGLQAATITSPPDGASNSTATTFTGTAAEMGSVDVRARPVGSSNPADFVDICAATPVDANGDWSCLASFPERRVWTVQAQSVTLSGLAYGPPASQTFTFDNERPDTTVVSTPGSLRLEATPGATGSTVSTVWRYYADGVSIGDVLISCPAAATQSCTVPGIPAPGLYLASSNAFANDAGSSDRGDFVRIPAAPVFVVADDSVPGRLTVAGTFDVTFSEPFGQVTGDGTPVVDVINADTLAPLCDDIELDGAGNWNCTIAAPPGTFDYVAVARTSTPIGTSNAQDVFSPGVSSRSNVMTTTVAPAGTLAITTPAPNNGSSEWLAGPTSFVIAGTSTLATPVDVLIDGAPLGTSCSALPVVAGDWSCTTALDPGTYEIRATQLGSTDAVMTWQVRIPPPSVGNDDLYVIDSWGTAEFFGTVYWTQGQVDVEVEVGDGAYESCFDDAPYGPVNDWLCAVSMYGYDDGTYNVRISIADGSERSDFVYLTLIVGEPPATPDLTCSFGPGSATISSAHPMSVYTMEAADPFSSGWSYELARQALCNGASGTTFPDGTLFVGSHISDCTPDCVLSGLAPGWYEIYVDSAGVSFSYVLTVPQTPTFTTTASSGSSVITTGTGTPFDRIQVQRTDGGVLCSTTVSAGGTWACTFPKSSAATARVIAVDPSSGGMSVYTASRSIPVGPASLPTETPAAAFAWLLQFGGDLSRLKPGDTITVTLDGIPVDWTIEVWMHSTPRLLGSTVGTGAPLTIDLTVPMDIESGAHEIEMVATNPDGTQYVERTDAMVLAAATTDDPATEEVTADDGAGGAGSFGAERADPAAPSALTDGLAPLSAIIDNPVSLVIAGGLALALLFFVALPTELLNSSLSSNTSRLGRAYGAVDGALTKAQDWLISVTHSRALAAALVVVLVAVIYGFVDPGFGFDLVSLRLVLSLAIAFFILSYGASWISSIIIHRAWGARGVVAIQPSIVLFAIVGVIVARILDFSPGFLVGVAIGLELVQASKRVSARAVFVQLAVVTGLALAAWVVYSLFSPGDDFAGLLVEDTMVALTAEGLTGAMIAVFPLRFLDGRELWDVSKRLWAASFLVVGTAFALLVLPTAVEGTDVGDIGVWLLVFAAFGAMSLAVWFVFARAEAREEAAEARRAEKVDA